MARSTDARRLGFAASVAAYLALLGFALGGIAGGVAFGQAPLPPPAPPAPVGPPAAVGPSPVAPLAEPPALVVVPPAAEAASAPPAAPRVTPVPTADENPALSDHDAVVGHLGIEARRFDPGPLPLALRAGFGCPAALTNPCTVTMGALGVRTWVTRNLAWNGSLAFAAGGGRDGTQTLDTYIGLGPIVGLSLLLGNWRHLTIGASPELGVVWFRPGPGAATRSTTMIELRGALEAELHFGFVGVPALSIGMLAGLGFQYESGPDTRVWSIGVVGAESVWGALSNLFVRYYL